jgi:hypothetical protein
MKDPAFATAIHEEAPSDVAYNHHQPIVVEISHQHL